MLKATEKILHVYLKVAERCNINCSYCYYFNKGNNDFEERDAFMREETMQEVASFLKRGAEKHNFNRVEVSLHGGEPLLLKRHRFELLCRLLRDGVGQVAELDIGVQTNATLVDEAWIDVFAKYGVAPAASLDGNREQNDVYRLDHSGRSTYEATKRGIGLMKAALDAGRVPRFGVLLVANPKGDGRAAYRHLVDDLEVRSMDFLLPEGTHERVDASNVEGLTRYMLDAFDEWRQDDDPGVRVRSFSNLLYVMSNGSDGVRSAATSKANHHDMTIHSDGAISLDDRIRLVSPEISSTSFSVRTHELEDLLGSSVYRDVTEIDGMLPDKCGGCEWTNTCAGGDMQNRYSKERGFNNPTAYCNTVKSLSEAVARYLLSSGTSIEMLTEALTFGVDSRRMLDSGDFRFRSDAGRMNPVVVVKRAERVSHGG